MTKHYLKTVLVFLILFITQRGYTQLIGTGLVEDPFRDPEKNSSKKYSNFKSASTSAVAAYTDTIRLPFFEDFSGLVVSIDSLVISSSDNLVKVYDAALNIYPDGTPVFIGFEAPGINTIQDTLSRRKWYIKKVTTNEFIIDTSASLTTPQKFFSTNVVYLNAYWRHITNDYDAQVDSLKWLSGGNTYINNRYPVDPVSYNVATFDGLKSNGVPYNIVNVLATGFTDNLTSLPIALKSLTAADDVYLSFYWQHSGVGDAPETNDFLELQFKDTSDLWIPVDTISGNILYTNSFKFYIIKISDPKYLFEDFQFRLRSYGRMSGPYDIWNVDYIYLNKNRFPADSTPLDLTVGNAEVSFLKNYTAMPYGQFFANKALETGSLDYSINNHYLDNTGFTYSYSLKCYYNEAVSGYFDSCTGPSHVNISDGKVLTFEENCAHSFSALNNMSQPMLVDHTYRIGFNDTTNIFFAFNNRYVTGTVLWDYYAYDDGSAEWAVGANQIGAKIANKFTTTIADTLTDIEIYFTRSKGPNMADRTILLTVWNENHVQMNQQPVKVKYGGYKRYKLTNPVIIGAGKSFYVGYQQNFVDLLTVGYDKNYDHSDKVFFNLGGSTWNKYSSQPGYVKGSMMIRPVFDKGQQLIITPVIEEEGSASEILLYPVPTDELLKIQGRVTSISLYDLAGRKLCSKTFQYYQEDKNVDVSSLPNGVFIAEIKMGDLTFIKKIIVQHTY
jgi:hypothetical protein